MEKFDLTILLDSWHNDLCKLLITLFIPLYTTPDPAYFFSPQDS